MSTWILSYAMLQATQEPIVVQQSANWTSVIMAIVTGLPAIISAVIAGMVLLQSRRNAEVAERTDKKVDSTSGKADVLIDKTTEIHTLTNSNLSKVQSQLDVSNKNNEGLNKMLVEAARRMANMELLITSLIPQKGQQTPSQTNSDKLDDLKSMLNDVQHGTPPIPVVDEAVLAKLDDVIVGKLDIIQESADAAAEKLEKEKKET